MIKLHPEILHHEGKPQFAVLPYAEFLAIQDELEDAACLRILRKAKGAEGAAKGISLKDLKSRLGLGTRVSRGAAAKRPRVKKPAA
jgi:hypothetical protein